MSIQATKRPTTFLGTAPAGGPAIVNVLPAWNLHDDTGPLCVIITAANGAPIAERIAELLNRHGLADIPDTLEQEPPPCAP